MRRVLLAAGLCMPCLTGCLASHDCRTCGFHFEILKPATITLETPVLVNAGTGPNTAHPMGSAAGPVTEGQHLVQPMAPPGAVTPKPVLNGTRSLLMHPIGCEQPQLTCEQWLKVVEQCKNSTPPTVK